MSKEKALENLTVTIVASLTDAMRKIRLEPKPQMLSKSRNLQKTRMNRDGRALR